MGLPRLTDKEKSRLNPRPHVEEVHDLTVFSTVRFLASFVRTESLVVLTMLVLELFLLYAKKKKAKTSKMAIFKC